MRTLACVAASCGLLVACGPARAEIVIELFESGGNVEARLHGSFDLDATLGRLGSSNAYDGLRPSLGVVSFTTGAIEYYRMSAPGWTPFGPGDASFGWSSSAGSAVAFYGNPYIGLPSGYVSGVQLSSSATLLDETFASVGIERGRFVTTFANGSHTDRVTIVTPSPGGACLLAAGALAARRRRGA